MWAVRGAIRSSKLDEERDLRATNALRDLRRGDRGPARGAIVKRLAVGVMTLATRAVLALLLTGQAVATQPECRVDNLAPGRGEYNSNTNADPLGTAIADARPGDTIEVIGTCHGNFAIEKDLTLQGRSSRQHDDTLDGDA